MDDYLLEPWLTNKYPKRSGFFKTNFDIILPEIDYIYRLKLY